MKKPLLAAGILLALLGDAPLSWAVEGGYAANQWWDLFFRFLCFAVLLGVLYQFARRPVIGFFRERRENIARNLEYLETQARNLEEQKEIMSRGIANLASEREAILAQYESLGQKEADRIMAEARVAAEALIEKTRDAMDLEIKNARQTLVAELVRLSTQAAQDLAKKNINADDQRRLSREFMDQVEKLTH